jgi:hypothetical protein
MTTTVKNLTGARLHIPEVLKPAPQGMKRGPQKEDPHGFAGEAFMDIGETLAVDETDPVVLDALRYVARAYNPPTGMRVHQRVEISPPPPPAE